MYAVTVLFTIKSDALEDFMPLMQQNAQTSLTSEPGCLEFDICTNAASPEEVFLYEVYTDRAAFEAHLHSPHFTSFNSAVAAMIADKDVRTFDQVLR